MYIVLTFSFVITRNSCNVKALQYNIIRERKTEERENARQRQKE